MVCVSKLSASQSNYFTSLHRYFGGLKVFLWAETENSPSLNGKFTLFCMLLWNAKNFCFVMIIISLLWVAVINYNVYILCNCMQTISGYIFLFTLVELECTDAMGLLVPVPAWEGQRVLSWPYWMGITSLNLCQVFWCLPETVRRAGAELFNGSLNNGLKLNKAFIII